MNLKELIPDAPELTEEKLLEIMDKHKNFLNAKSWSRNKYTDMKSVLDEWDLIQIKKSYLTKSQRDDICGFVSICLIEMTRGEPDGATTSTD